MKHLFFQLINKIKKAFKKLIKKPLFIEILTGTSFSIVIIILSVSGLEKSSLKNDFDKPAEETTTDNSITLDDYNQYDMSDLTRGDALSEIQYTITESSLTSRTENNSLQLDRDEPVTITPPPATSVPEAIDPETEIEELPEVTFSPDTSEEPEVILDPFGPVMVSNFTEEFKYTTAFGEAITLTAYNSSGDKLPKENISVYLNNTQIHPELSYNQSFSYYLNYIEGNNILDIIVTDEKYSMKTYSYTVNYLKDPEETALISVDADSIGLGYMIPPTTVIIEEGKTVAYYVKQLLGSNGFSTYSSGSQNKHYKFNGLYRPGLYSNWQSQFASELEFELLLYNPSYYIDRSKYYTDFIKNGYFTAGSAWIFELNGERFFGSMSDHTLKDGDILKVRFSLADGVDLDWLSKQYNPTLTETE